MTLNIERSGAESTIHILADGSINPSTANIVTVDNVVYTFMDNVYEAIVVERDDIVIDGAGHTLQGTGGDTGIDLTERSNVTIENIISIIKQIMVYLKAFFDVYCIYIYIILTILFSYLLFFMKFF